MVGKERIKISKVREGRNLKREKLSRETNKREIECSRGDAIGSDWMRKRETGESYRERKIVTERKRVQERLRG